MRVYIVCALVGAGFLYYMMQQDTTGPRYGTSGTSATHLMSECVREKTSGVNTSYVHVPTDQVEKVCARELNLRRLNGEWVNR